MDPDPVRDLHLAAQRDTLRKQLLTKGIPERDVDHVVDSWLALRVWAARHPDRASIVMDANPVGCTEEVQDDPERG